MAGPAWLPRGAAGTGAADGGLYWSLALLGPWLLMVLRHLASWHRPRLSGAVPAAAPLLSKKGEKSPLREGERGYGDKTRDAALSPPYALGRIGRQIEADGDAETLRDRQHIKVTRLTEAPG